MSLVSIPGLSGDWRQGHVVYSWDLRSSYDWPVCLRRDMCPEEMTSSSKGSLEIM